MRYFKVSRDVTLLRRRMVTSAISLSVPPALDLEHGDIGVM